MNGVLADRRIAFLTANEGVERVELTEPWERVTREGGTAVLVATHAGSVALFDHLTPAEERTADLASSEADPADYDALVLPGGVANADRLRTDEAAVAFARAFLDAGKPVAVICHGPWTLIEADAVAGRRLTSWPSLQTDLRNAGAEWVDEQVVVCTAAPSTLVSSRKPDDLKAFCDALTEAFGQGAADARQG